MDLTTRNNPPVKILSLSGNFSNTTAAPARLSSDDLADNLMAGVDACVAGQRRGCDADIAIGIDRVEIAARYPGKAVAYTYPVMRLHGQRLPRKILHLQWRKGGEIRAWPELSEKTGEQHSPGAKFHR